LLLELYSWTPALDCFGCPVILGYFECPPELGAPFFRVFEVFFKDVCYLNITISFNYCPLLEILVSYGCWVWCITLLLCYSDVFLAYMAAAVEPWFCAMLTAFLCMPILISIKYNGSVSLLVAFELTFLFPVALELLTTIVLVDLGISAAIS
jgi:hypothetical protein